MSGENTFKNYYYPEEHDVPSDEDEHTLAFKIKKAIANKRPSNSIHGFFEKRKKKKVAKHSSSVSQATDEGVAFIKSNNDDGAYALQLIKIEVYDWAKIKGLAPTEHWKFADVRLKYYVHSENDDNLEKTKDVIYNITKQLAAKSDCANFLIDNGK